MVNLQSSKYPVKQRAHRKWKACDLRHDIIDINWLPETKISTSAAVVKLLPRFQNKICPICNCMAYYSVKDGLDDGLLKIIDGLVQNRGPKELVLRAHEWAEDCHDIAELGIV